MAQPRNNEKAVNDIMAIQLRKVPQVFVSECVLYMVQCCVYVRVCALGGVGWGWGICIMAVHTT